MKIALASTSSSTHADWARSLQALGHTVLSLPTPSGLRTLDVPADMDAVLLEGLCDAAGLAAVAQLTRARPQLAVVLLCPQPSPEFLMQAMRVGVREVLPAPASEAVLQETLARLAQRQQGSPSADRGRLLAFMPCKGGSGTTFLATNLGYQLAEAKSVLLIDLNLQFGDALSLVHEHEPPQTLADLARDIHRLDAAFLAACAVKVTPRFSVLPAPQDLGQAVDIQSAQVQAIIDLAVQHYDFVLLDLGRNLDHLTVKAMDRADHLFMVLQAGLPWLRQARRLQQLFVALEYPEDKVQWIVNRFEKSGDIGLDQIGRTLKTERLRTVANAYRDVKTAVTYGTALVEVLKSSAVTRNLSELALSLDPRQGPPSSLLGRLLRRA